ncbi:NADH dehydrogenase [ubiquinone] 1 subunit C2 [Colius striatus]|uniref:NADH dehydrogenase [ubiquinone] 1 subunit C2 n=1 Tax=Colius striatus TaxID=57412 RepID=UPI002B1E5727|nr:NADH dehydrogenase [ubiquinone] 1 subunit C2 [Colius striatus]
MTFLPDESRSLPPPPLLNQSSFCLGLTGWVAAMLDNIFNRRPVIKAGVHRQILFTTVGWFAGYYLMKRSNYVHAKLDRELLEYVRHHPEDFKAAEKKRIGELMEDFHPIR